MPVQTFLVFVFVINLDENSSLLCNYSKLSGSCWMISVPLVQRWRYICDSSRGKMLLLATRNLAISRR